MPRFISRSERLFISAKERAVAGKIDLFGNYMAMDRLEVEALIREMKTKKAISPCQVLVQNKAIEFGIVSEAEILR